MVDDEKRAPARHKFSLRLDDDLWQKLVDASERHGVPVNVIINAAIRQVVTCA